MDFDKQVLMENLKETWRAGQVETAKSIALVLAAVILAEAIKK
jgi:hypothetical protein